MAMWSEMRWYWWVKCPYLLTYLCYSLCESNCWKLSSTSWGKGKGRLFPVQDHHCTASSETRLKNFRRKPYKVIHINICTCKFIGGRNPFPVKYLHNLLLFFGYPIYLLNPTLLLVKRVMDGKQICNEMVMKTSLFLELIMIMLKLWEKKERIAESCTRSLSVRFPFHFCYVVARIKTGCPTVCLSICPAMGHFLQFWILEQAPFSNYKYMCSS